MKYLIALYILAGFVTSQDSPKCYALALGQGDENAAYQVGVLKGLITNGKLSPGEVAYDAVSGISAGAVNAVMLASFAKS
jgi:predicted acylesterase/phospholipase RssA